MNWLLFEEIANYIKLNYKDISIRQLSEHFHFNDMIPYFRDKYDKWSKYIPEKKGVVLAFASMYGNTENAVNALASKPAERGVKDMTELVNNMKFISGTTIGLLFSYYIPRI